MASLSQPSDGEIMFTTDGSSPRGAKAKSYSQPFRVDSATVVRAWQKSKTLIPRYESRAVYVDLNKHQIPVVLLVTAPENLWDDEIGILVEGNDRNFEKRTDDWIRDGSIVYYENGQQVFSGAVDFKNYGAGTRVRPKKSMTIIADDPMPNHFFSSTEREEVDGFVLRACYSEASRFKNEAVNGVNQLMGSHTMMQEYHPVAFYINGNYWGIYNLSERKNTRFIQAHHGVTPTDILTSNGPRTTALKGSTDDFIQFIDSINSLTMNEPHIMNYVAENFDMTSLFDFWIHELYTNKSDRFNNKFWRSKKGDNKWRFVSYDFDIGFVWPDNPKTLKNFKDTEAVGINFFGRLMMNQEFSTAFFTRLCDYLNFGYTKSNMTNIIEELDSLTKHEFKLDYARWSSEWKKCLDQGDNSKKKIIKFMEPRAQHLRDSIAAAFELTEKVTIENPSPEKGNLYVNGHLVQAPAVYFTGMKVNLKAEPKEGFSFNEWSSQVSEKEETPVLKKSGRIQVVFE